MATAVLLLCLAPVLEEIVFRRGLQETLLQLVAPRDAIGLPVINVVTALTFAGAHLWAQPGALAALTAVPALLIGFVYQRQRRLAPCIALHCLFNAAWLAWASLPS